MWILLFTLCLTICLALLFIVCFYLWFLPIWLHCVPVWFCLSVIYWLLIRHIESHPLLRLGQFSTIFYSNINSSFFSLSFFPGMPMLCRLLVLLMYNTYLKFYSFLYLFFSMTSYCWCHVPCLRWAHWLDFQFPFCCWIQLLYSWSLSSLL